LERAPPSPTQPLDRTQSFVEMEECQEAVTQSFEEIESTKPRAADANGCRSPTQDFEERKLGRSVSGGSNVQKNEGTSVARGGRDVTQSPAALSPILNCEVVNQDGWNQRGAVGEGEDE